MYFERRKIAAGSRKSFEDRQSDRFDEERNRAASSNRSSTCRRSRSGSALTIYIKAIWGENFPSKF